MKRKLLLKVDSGNDFSYLLACQGFSSTLTRQIEFQQEIPQMGCLSTILDDVASHLP